MIILDTKVIVYNSVSQLSLIGPVWSRDSGSYQITLFLIGHRVG